MDELSIWATLQNGKVLVRWYRGNTFVFSHVFDLDNPQPETLGSSILDWFSKQIIPQMQVSPEF